MKYYRPSTIPEATEALARYNGAARIIAGGTDLITHWKAGETYPAAVIDVSGIADLRSIKRENDLIRIGAAVTFQEIVESKDLMQTAPLLVQACSQIGVWQVRNRGTIGGNIANASPVADSVPALLCLDAEIVVNSEKGVVIRPLEPLFKGPGRTDLRPIDVITEIRFSPQDQDEIYFYQKLGQRKAQCIAKVSVGFRALNFNGVLTRSRIYLGAVGPTVLRAVHAEEILNGRTLTEDRIRSVIWAAAEDSTPISDLRSEKGYRHDMVAALLYKNLKQNLMQ